MNEKTNFLTILTKSTRLAVYAILGVCTAALFAAIFAVIVKLLWNWLMPAIFGITTITFFQAFGLIVLARLLVGGWHHDHGDFHHKRKGDHVHRFFDREMGGMPDEFRMNRNSFRMFWAERGRENFKAYMEEKNKPGEE